jgi:hypothetical protein
MMRQPANGRCMRLGHAVDRCYVVFDQQPCIAQREDVEPFAIHRLRTLCLCTCDGDTVVRSATNGHGIGMIRQRLDLCLGDGQAAVFGEMQIDICTVFVAGSSVTR